MAELFKGFNLSKDFFHLEQITKQQLGDKPSEQAKEQDSKELTRSKEKASEEGYKIGFKQGFDEGDRKGQELARKAIEELELKIHRLLQTLSHAINENRLSLKTEIADFVLAITERFFIEQQQNKEAIAQQISRALSHVNDKQSLTLVLNPEDLSLLQKGELQVDFSLCQNLRVIADETLKLGGCLIRSEHGVFDAGIEGQIERLKQVLLEIKAEGNHGKSA
ncbi:MAG: hypothetical protein H0U57_03645 [Tatlockia sp.]|nr:hypothetical protein [Tatlockia sp.]